MKNLKQMAKKLNGTCLDFKGFNLVQSERFKEKAKISVLAFTISLNLKKMQNDYKVLKPLAETSELKKRK